MILPATNLQHDMEKVASNIHPKNLIRAYIESMLKIVNIK